MSPKTATSSGVPLVGCWARACRSVSLACPMARVAVTASLRFAVLSRRYCRMRQPVRKIHQTAARQRAVKAAMASRLTPMGTSAVSKNDQRNTDMR